MIAARPDSLQWAANLGFALRVLTATERSTWRLASIQAFLDPPIRLGQIEFIFGSNGAPLGYFTWAFLSHVVALDLETTPSRLLSLDEWNEGTQLWIIDVVAPTGGTARLLSRARARFASHRRVHWLDRRQGCHRSARLRTWT